MSDVELPDQMAEAIRRQRERWQASAGMDRKGWSDQQWINDAWRLFHEPNGAITSLVNGHVDRMLKRLYELKQVVGDE